MVQNQEIEMRTRKPRWLRRRLPTGSTYEEVRGLLRKSRLHTVCQEAKCPNVWECFSKRISTFLIMGPYCTRNCRFCSVANGPCSPPDPQEPVRVAEAAQRMGLSYVVITSVTRDDLPDGGASVFARTIREIRHTMPDALVEVLIPDFGGKTDSLETVLKAKPDVLNHNLETVSRLYPSVRPEASYRRSLELLRLSGELAPAIAAKSGLMLGLGESSEEVKKTVGDLLDVGCHILTLGQYLQPTRQHLKVERFVHPEEFDDWRKTALQMGFSQVASGPFVRSSYNAKELYRAPDRQSPK